MTDQLCLTVLGPMEATIGDERIALGGPRQRALLAVLVAAYPASVSLERLADAVWDGDPPATHQATLHAYASRIRKLVSPAVALVCDPQGYRLVLHAATIDAGSFSIAVARAQQELAEGRLSEVIELLQPALALWRSASVLDPWENEPWARDYAAGLTEQRLVGAEILAEAHLQLDQPRAAVADLEALVAQRPYAESTARLLMVALYRDHRQAEALRLFDRCRHALSAELGIDPSAALQKTHQQILTHHPLLDWHPAATAVAPRILPPRPRLVVGRDQTMAQVERQLAESGTVTLYGLPGSGKTTVAAEIAHEHPGLVCWVPAEDRAGVLNAFAELASRLGVPAGLAESELLESLWTRLGALDDWLLVFDNAEHPDTVRRFVPPVRNGQLIITSRSPAWSALGGTIKIGPLDDAAALAFVRRRTGREEDGSSLAEAMGKLPLALEQACSYIDETGMTLAQYLQILARRRTELLSRGAPAAHPHPVTTTWELVFEDVRRRSDLAAEILEVSAYLSAEGLPLSMLEMAVDVGGDELRLADALAELLRFSIVDRSESSLRVHRLVQSVVRSQLSPADRHLRAAAALRSLQSSAPSGPVVPDSWPAWSLVTPHVLAFLRAAVDSDVLPDGTVHLALRCYRYLRARSALDSAHDLLDLVIALVESVRGRVPVLGELHADRADLLDAEGSLAEARVELEQALAIFEENADSVPEVTMARTWARLAHALNCSDEPASSADHYRRALTLLRSCGGEPEEVTNALIGLGYACWAQQDYWAAEEHLRAALTVLDEQGWTRHPLHADAVSGLGMMLHEQGRLAEAQTLQLAALGEMIEVHGAVDHPAIAYTYDKLGYVEGLLGDHPASMEHHGKAVEILQRLFGLDDARLAMMISNLGSAQLACGDVSAAVASQQRAYAILLEHYGSAHRDTRLVAARAQDLLVCIA
ncbi:MAG TPA: BTAD domain-containing putative transcriptional regulator [Propionibacteriaceae bacterium]